MTPDPDPRLDLCRDPSGACHAGPTHPDCDRTTSRASWSGAMSGTDLGRMTDGWVILAPLTGRAQTMSLLFKWVLWTEVAFTSVFVS